MIFKLWLYGIISGSVTYTNYIFPEFPAIGAAVVAAAILLFVFYLIKQGIKTAFKIAFVVILSSAVFLFSLHSVMKIVQFFFM